MKFVNLDESEIIEQPLEKVIARPDYSPVEFVYDDLCSLDSVSVDGIHPSGDDPDLILPPSVNKINNCFKSEYFKISNLFSEIQTYEQKQQVLKNLGILDAINDSSYIYNLGDGLTYNGREMVVNHDLTLQTTGGKLGVNMGKGLYVNPDNQLSVHTGKGLAVNHADSTVEVAEEVFDKIEGKADKTETENLRKALEAENKRAEQAEESLENVVQMLQDETEDLQSIRDDVERLGSDKADKSALEATNKEVSKKQNKLDNYKEDPSNGSVEIFAQDKVSVRNDSQGSVSCVEVYNEEDTEGIIPVARMSADKENGDYASVTVRGNEVHIDGDAVKVNGVDLENVGVTIVNDLTTGGVDKALSAEMGKVLVKNSFNSPKMKGYVYNYGSGKLVTTASLSGQCSSKIACLPNRLYYVKNKGLSNIRIIYWDATDTYIGSFTHNENTNRSVSPSNAAYMAVFTDTTNTWEYIFIEDISDVDFLHVDFNTDVATTRKSVPYIFRKIGLVLSYIVDGERVLEVFNTTPGTYLNDYAWTEDSAWDKFTLNKEHKDQVAETAKIIDLAQKASYSKSEYLNPVWTEGYINSDGEVKSNSDFKYSSPISLHKGERLIVYGRATSSISIISLYTDGVYKPLVLGTNSTSPEEFIYEAEIDCEVVVCYLSAWSAFYVARTSNKIVEKLIDQQRQISKIYDNTIILVKSKNLLDPSKAVVGLLRGTGNVSETMTEYLTSDYIDVEPNTNYIISTSAGKVYCYGEYLNENIINYQTPNSTQINITTLSTTNRIRIGYVNTATAVQVAKGDTATSYEPYNKPTELGTDKEGRPILVKAEEQFIIDSSQNLIILETFTKIGYYKWDGTYVEDNKYRTSNTIIGLEGGKTYSHNLTFVSFKLYDKNMQPIGYQYNPTSPFIAKSGAKFAEVSTGLVNLSTLNCILVEGETIPDEIGKGYFPIIKKDRESGMDVVAILGDKKPIQKNFWYKKKYASLGDSVTYRNQWQRIVDFHLGTTHVNFACSGMTVGGYAFHYTTGGSEEGSQIGTAVADRLLDAQDFADCQLIIVCGYANNAYGNSGNGTVIGTMEDDYKIISEDDISNYTSVNEYRKSITGQTFIAACRSTIEYLQKVAPHARIVVSGQLLMDTSYLPNYDANNIDLHRKNGQGLDTIAYSDAMKEVAEYYSLPYVDLARRGGVNNMNWQLYYPASDQVHPNFANYTGGEDYPDSGMYKMARGIIGVLESI